jgi:hypothetical protein
MSQKKVAWILSKPPFINYVRLLSQFKVFASPDKLDDDNS